MTGDAQLGRRIHDARVEAELTQRQLAQRVGLGDSQSISNYERGVTDVPRDRLRRIAAATGKPLQFFVVETDVIEPTCLLEQVAAGVDELQRSADLSFALLTELRERLERLEG